MVIRFFHLTCDNEGAGNRRGHADDDQRRNRRTRRTRAVFSAGSASSALIVVA